MPVTSQLDRISITGLRVFAHHGVFAEERANGQEFVIDLVVELDLAPAGASDVLGRTVHYGELAEAVAAAAATEPVDLIETLAERIASVALGFAAVERVSVTVHKPNAPIALDFADVAVTIVRNRS